MSWLTVTSNGIVQWLQDRLAGNTAVWEGSTSQHSGQRSQHVSSREALKLQMLPLDVPLKQQQEPRALLQLPSSLPACHSASSSTKPSSTLRQSLTQAASKLSCKTVVDMNSGLCSTELAWHVRAQEQQQQPARMAVKVSNRHKTRVTFDAQVALG
jgi:hypothetical protein